jgi:hypothetical protein
LPAEERIEKMDLHVFGETATLTFYEQGSTFLSVDQEALEEGCSKNGPTTIQFSSKIISKFASS